MPRKPPRETVCSPPSMTGRRARAAVSSIVVAIVSTASWMLAPSKSRSPTSTSTRSSRSRSSAGLYVSRESERRRTAPGPAPIPGRKLPVASSGAPKNAAAASRCASPEESVKRCDTCRRRPEASVGVVISQSRGAYAPSARFDTSEAQSLTAEQNPDRPQEDAEVVAEEPRGTPCAAGFDVGEVELGVADRLVCALRDLRRPGPACLDE